MSFATLLNCIIMLYTNVIVLSIKSQLLDFLKSLEGDAQHSCGSPTRFPYTFPPVLEY
jgi:hypothetical protein